MLLCSWMRRISTLKCQFLKGKKNWMQFLVLTHSLYEGWKWRRIKKCKNLYGRKKMPSTANKQRIKKRIEWFFPSQVAKLTLILSWFKKQLFATPVASGLMILHEGAQLQQSRLHVPPLPSLTQLQSCSPLVSWNMSKMLPTRTWTLLFPLPALSSDLLHSHLSEWSSLHHLQQLTHPTPGMLNYSPGIIFFFTERVTTWLCFVLPFPSHHLGN